MRHARAGFRRRAARALAVGWPLLAAALALPSFRAHEVRTSPVSESDPTQEDRVTPWPRPIPVRLEPEGRDELLVTTLGEVSTPLADGTYDPVNDRVTTDDGRVIESYYKTELGVPYYRPLDKSRFPLPPSGWCSWYYYYQEIDAGEVLANARWLARYLAPYGARYVQVDDGWQGSGHGLGGNRDWTTIDRRFREIGMKGLADSIRALGLEAGIWLAPHGQSNEQVARRSGAFLWRSDGASASETWVGRYLLDPSVAAAHAYLRDLFTTLVNWGFTYFKLDGQPLVLEEYTSKQRYMAGPPPAGEDSAAIAAELYRGTLQTIRDAVGEGSYLLGSWGTPLAGIGVLDGARTGGDIVQGWQGFLIAAESVQRWNFLHNIAWYSDPDAILVRPPLSDGMARAWATIQGLSGQALMVADRLPDLPASRVEILRRIFPAVDIRPLDLYKPDNVRKPIWDLKVNHLGRSYDVVALFNYDTERALNRLIAWEQLGLDPNRAYHVYDFWQGTYLGAWSNGVFLVVPPADVRVITLVPERPRPVLVSTSRHITQGWVDLLELEPGGIVTRPTLSGRSRVIAGDPYTLTVGLPRKAPTFRIAGAGARGERPGTNVHVTAAGHQGYATVTLESDATQVVEWQLRFEPAEPYVYPVVSPSRLQATQEGLAAVTLRWPAEYHVKAGYRVKVDGRPQGTAFQPRARLSDLPPGRSYRIGVRSVWSDGSGAETAAEATYTPEIPDTLYLSDLEPESARQDWGELGRDRSVEGNPLSVRGARSAKGLGTHAASEIRYRLFGAFERFEAAVGIDDEVSPPTPVHVRFEVWGDGRRLWSSAAIDSQREALPIDIAISGVRELVLKVLPTDGGIDYAHADWLNARVIARP